EAPARPAHEGRREVECVAPRSERLEQLLRTQIVVSILYPSLKPRIDAAEPHRYGGSVPGSGIATASPCGRRRPSVGRCSSQRPAGSPVTAAGIGSSAQRGALPSSGW